MATANYIFKRVRAILDEWTDDGTVIPDADVVDLKEKTILFIDMAQQELFKENKNYKEFEFSHSPIENLLKNGFSQFEFSGDTQYYPSEEGVVGAKSYYFEVDDDADVYIQELISGTWTDIETINASVGDYTAFKGLLSVSDSNNPIRLKMDGTTFYRHRNRALFKEPFASDRIPDYKPMFKVELPDDFRGINDIIKEEWNAKTKYEEFYNYKWEGLNNLYLNWYFSGNVRILYNAIPEEITSIDDDLGVDKITAQAIIYFVVSKIAPYENKELVNYAEERFNELVYKLQQRDPVAENRVENVYGDLNGNI